MTMTEMANMVVGLAPAGPALTLPDSLLDELRHLAVQRAWTASLDAKIKAARAGFDATIAHELQNLEAAKRGVEAAEFAVRALALVIHETTGLKAPCAGVSVVMTKEYAIDEAAGFLWAQAHGMCLIPAQLDKRAAAKMATVQPLPFVKVTESASVRIASDLYKVLAEVLP